MEHLATEEPDITIRAKKAIGTTVANFYIDTYQPIFILWLRMSSEYFY